MPKLGNKPIGSEYTDLMNKLAVALDHMFNEDNGKKTGFILMVFPFGHKKGRCNYISNAERADVILLLKEQLRYFEGQPEIEGQA